MDKIIELLMKQPIVAFFLVIWVIGAITNALKAKQKVRERNEAKLRPTAVARTEPAGSISAGETSAGNIAGRAVGGSKPGAVVGGMGTGQQKKLEQQRQAPTSMRGRDRQVIPAAKAAPVAKPAAKTSEQVAREMRRILGLEPEPPTASPAPARATPPSMPSEPVLMNSASAQLRTSPATGKKNIDPHVGEGIRGRHLAASKVGQTPKKQSDRGAIGNLGGRTKVRKKRLVEYERRYAMTDLRRLIVMNEILSPPITMRANNDRLV